MGGEGTAGGYGGTCSPPDTMCLYGNPWHFLMKTKLLHTPSLLLSWPNLLLCYHHMLPLLERSHVGLGLTLAPPLHHSFLLPLEEAWWLALTLAEVTSAGWGGGKPVKGTEKLMQCRLGA